MVTIGIDATEIERFSEWHTYSTKKLKRIFSDEEIAYCLAIKTKTSERFATRFAAKEAVYKALFPLLSQPQSFLKVSKYTSVGHTAHGAPMIHVDWDALSLKPLNLQVSLTHTTTTALAVVVIES